MKKAVRRSISLILVVVMMFTAAPVFALESSAKADPQMKALAASSDVSPQEMRDVVEKVTDAMSRFVADTSQMTKFGSLLTRFGGVVSLAGGAMGILEMAGIIKDPTEAMMSELLGEIHSMQDQLNVIDRKLNELNQQLISVAVRQEEKDRNNKGTTMLKYWNDFNREYCEPLDDRINKYQGKINEGIKTWWGQSNHNGVLVLYSMQDQDKDGTTAPALTYSLAEYSEGIPAKADNEETVDADVSFGVPAEYLPNTAAIRFSVSNYRNDFETRMAKSFITAADGHKLDATEAFYQTWDALTKDEKAEQAALYAADILNSQIYCISCDVMSKDDQFVIDVTNAYRNYCNNIMKQDSGINAWLNAMYLTHGFEGEVKEDIETFCDAMVVQAALYGQFAINCACQDDMQSLSNRKALRKQFANTVKSLSDRKRNALTGHDNYCYITGTLMSHEYIHAKSTVVIQNKGDAYKGFSASNWSITVPNILDDVYSQVLYNQYQTQNQGKKSFAAYLNAYGAFPSDENMYIMTKYGGNETFPLSDGIRMKADSLYAGESYFNSWSYYDIDLGNDSRIDRDYFHLHDRVVCDLLDMNTGAVQVNQTAAARALYGEGHWYWSTDETWMFYTDRNSNGRFNDILTGSSRDGNYVTKTFDLGLHVLKLEPCHDMNGSDPEDPFLAYGHPSLTPGVSNELGPTYQDNTKDLTALELEGTSFTHTGKGITPKVTVKSGKKTVPAKGYSITYSDNTEIGEGMVTVTGKGSYSDSISMKFSIVPKGTSISKIKRSSKTSANVKWKKRFIKYPSEREPDGTIDGYQIRYSTKSSMKNAKTVTFEDYNKTSAKISGLKKNKKYYFQVRTFMHDEYSYERIYSKWSKKKNVK